MQTQRARGIQRVQCVRAIVCGCAVLGGSTALYGQPMEVLARPDSLRLEDLVTRKDVQEVRISPDGRWVAYVVKQGSLKTDGYHYSLYVAGTRVGNAPVRLLESVSAWSNVRWSPDGRWISYLSSKGGSVQLWRINSKGGKETRLFHHAPGRTNYDIDYAPHGGGDQQAGVFAYEWSPSGRRIAFTTATPLMPAARARMEAAGVVYDDERMTFTDLVTRNWVRHPTELWAYDVRSGHKSQLWKVDGDIPALAWSPDESRIAVTYSAPPRLQESMVFFDQDLGIVTVDGGKFHPVSAGEAYEAEPAWAPDGVSLAFVSLLGLRTSTVSVLNSATGERKELGRGRVGWISDLGWMPNGQDLWFEAPDSGVIRRGKSAVYRLRVATDSITEVSAPVGHLSLCSVDQEAKQAACIWQTPARSPAPALVDVPTGGVTALARLNPELEAKLQGQVTELHWTNRYGAETNGFLVKPAGYTEGTRYPTLVVLYWFEGRFMAEAEWILNYPIQLFARDGFAVLLVNYPKMEDWRGKSFAEGAMAKGYSPLASIEEGLDQLIEAGITDSTRLGIMGWSYGGFLAQFALTQSKRFKAASAGADGDLNPGAYWLLGRRTFRENYERLMGGPPYGETLKNWVEFSPAFNTHRVQAPVLMEASAIEAILGLEMSAAYRRHGVPVEFAVYPDEGHNFTRPQHRYHSMQRNLDWFNFWLQGREDPAPDKRSQYQRWRAMKDALAAPCVGKGAACAVRTLP
jgi:dipeptidyl aminopeptidase/acylaminoacyl peptidase